MTDVELATELRTAFARSEHRGDLGWWVDAARRARALLSTPTLPAEPPEGCVRVRALAAVYADGTWSATGSSGWGAAAEKYHAASAQKHGGRVSFATFDAPKPEPAAEIVAVAEPAP